MTTTQPERKRIYSYMTRSTFLHIEDAIEIGKIRLFAGKYTKGQGMKENAHHYLDVDDARPILLDLSWSKAVEETDFKGSANGGGEIISRVMSIKSKDDKVWIEIKNGPGRKSETGAVMPAGEPTSAVSIGMSKKDARKLALCLMAYIAAQESMLAIADQINRALLELATQSA